MPRELGGMFTYYYLSICSLTMSYANRGRWAVTTVIQLLQNLTAWEVSLPFFSNELGSECVLYAEHGRIILLLLRLRISFILRRIYNKYRIEEFVNHNFWEDVVRVLFVVNTIREEFQSVKLDTCLCHAAIGWIISRWTAIGCIQLSKDQNFIYMITQNATPMIKIYWIKFYNGFGVKISR